MKETYSELQVTPSGEYNRFVDFIFTLACEAIEERDGTIVVRCEEELDSVEFGVKVFARSLSKVLDEEISVKTTLEKKANIDWIENYQKHVQPIEIGEFYIHPSWIEKKENRLNILIEPALVFGSGHHETTHGCLLMLQKYLQKNSRVLDVGCGSGILSIASAKLGAIVDFCDTDELAVHSASRNFELNREEYNNTWVGSAQKRDEQYDVVVVNIIADVLIEISSDLASAIKKDGILILSGVLDKQIKRVKIKFSSMKILEKYRKDEWYTLVLKR